MKSERTKTTQTIPAVKTEDRRSSETPFRALILLRSVDYVQKSSSTRLVVGQSVLQLLRQKLCKVKLEAIAERQQRFRKVSLHQCKTQQKKILFYFSLPPLTKPVKCV